MSNAMNEESVRRMIADLQGMLPGTTSTAEKEAVTFGELAERYIESRRASGVGIEGLPSRLAGLTAFFSLFPVDLLDESLWTYYKAARRAGGSDKSRHFAVSTLNLELTNAKAILSKGVDDGLITRNPFSKIALERGANKRRGTISEEQLQRMLEVIELPWFRAYVLLLADTGLRRSEGLRVRWADVERGYIVVRREDSKTKVARTIKLTTRAQAALMALPRIGAEFVFASRMPHRETLATVHVGVMFKRAAECAGIILPTGERPTCHFLRHSWASRAVLAGVSLPAVQAVLGHSNLATTQIYLHPTQGDSDGAIDTASRAAIGRGRPGDEMRMAAPQMEPQALVAQPEQRPTPARLLTRLQAAELLGSTLRRVDELIDSRVLKTYAVGQTRGIDPISLRAAMTQPQMTTNTQSEGGHHGHAQ